MILLVAHLLAATLAVSLDLVFPFSTSQEAARFIRQNGLAQMLLVGHHDDAASSVAGCLGRPIYYPSTRRWGTFIVWDQTWKNNQNIKAPELVKHAQELMRQYQQDALLLLNYELPPSRLPITLLQKFTNSLVPDENYYLYLVQPIS